MLLVVVGGFPLVLYDEYIHALSISGHLLLHLELARNRSPLFFSFPSRGVFILTWTYLSFILNTPFCECAFFGFGRGFAPSVTFPNPGPDI